MRLFLILPPPPLLLLLLLRPLVSTWLSAVSLSTTIYDGPLSPFILSPLRPLLLPLRFLLLLLLLLHHHPRRRRRRRRRR